MVPGTKKKAKRITGAYNKTHNTHHPFGEEVKAPNAIMKIIYWDKNYFTLMLKQEKWPGWWKQQTSTEDEKWG